MVPKRTRSLALTSRKAMLAVIPALLIRPLKLCTILVTLGSVAAFAAVKGAPSVVVMSATM